MMIATDEQFQEAWEVAEEIVDSLKSDGASPTKVLHVIGAMAFQLANQTGDFESVAKGIEGISKKIVETALQ